VSDESLQELVERAHRKMRRLYTRLVECETALNRIIAESEDDTAVSIANKAMRDYKGKPN
jgi:hypothetical protein